MTPKMARSDLGAITKIRANVKTFIIGNNSVKKGYDVNKMIRAGANAVSIARAVKENPELFYSIKEEYSEFK